MKSPRIDWRAIARNRFNHLLTLLSLLFLAGPFLMVDDGMAPDPLVWGASFAAMIGICRAVISDDRQFYRMLALIFVSISADIAARFGYFLGHEMIYTVVVRFAQSLLLLVINIRLMQWLFRVEAVDADTIKGGICVYLMLGFLWLGFYRICLALNPAAFSREFTNFWEIIYFSFTTLTTVGYGDITPKSPLAMLFSNLEGIVGQLFLTIFVARLVGLHILHHTTK